MISLYQKMMAIFFWRVNQCQYSKDYSSINLEWVIENENVTFWQIFLKLIGLGTINHNITFVIDNKSDNKEIFFVSFILLFLC